MSAPKTTEDGIEYAFLNQEISPFFLSSEGGIVGQLEGQGASIEVMGDDPTEVWTLREIDKAMNVPSPNYVTLRRSVKTWMIRTDSGKLLRLRGNVYLDGVLEGMVGRTMLIHNEGISHVIKENRSRTVADRVSPWKVYSRRPLSPQALNAMIAADISSPLTWEQISSRPMIGVCVARGVAHAADVGAHLADRDPTIRYACEADVLVVGLRSEILLDDTPAPYRPDPDDENTLDFLVQRLHAGRTLAEALEDVIAEMVQADKSALEPSAQDAAGASAAS